MYLIERWFTESDIKQYGEAAKSTGVSVQHFNVSEYDEVAAAFARIFEWQANGMVLSQNPLFSLIREELAHAALSLRLPLMTSSDTYVAAGALISYSASLRHALQSGGALVKRLLKGERAGDIPVLLPAKFELFLNMKTAHALGLTFPPLTGVAPLPSRMNSSPSVRDLRVCALGAVIFILHRVIEDVGL